MSADEGDTFIMRHLQECPPQVLFTRGRPKRVGALVRWCAARGIQPTLLQVETERDRRRSLDSERNEK